MAVGMASTMIEAMASGDSDVARVAHEALGRLLAPKRGETAEVVDLSTRRRR